MILSCKNDALWDEIGFTEDIEEGIGPVMIGPRAVFIDENGDRQYVVSHPFAEVDGAWLEAYTSGDNPMVTIVMETVIDENGVSQLVYATSVPSTWTQPELE
jgi:hypothetical protein